MVKGFVPLMKNSIDVEDQKWHFWSAIGHYGNSSSFDLCTSITLVGDSTQRHSYLADVNLKAFILW